jgi:hypothetical protein
VVDVIARQRREMRPKKDGLLGMFDPILLVFVLAFMTYAVLMYRKLRQNVKYRYLARLFFIACVIAGLMPLIVSVFERNDGTTSVQSNGARDGNSEDIPGKDGCGPER